MTPQEKAERRLRLEAFLDEHGGVIGTALEVYAEHMRESAEPLAAQYAAIKDDAEASAAQDKTWVTTLGLKHMAGLFRDSADRADRAATALSDLQEEEAPE